VVPLKPHEGIPDWLWATACAVSILTRKPEFFDHFQEAVWDATEQWLRDKSGQRVLAEARDRLPPEVPPFPLLPHLVLEGRWRESTNEDEMHLNSTMMLSQAIMVPALSEVFQDSATDLKSPDPGQVEQEALDGLGQEISRSLYIGINRRRENEMADTRTGTGTASSSSASVHARARAKARAKRGQQIVGLQKEFNEAKHRQQQLPPPPYPSSLPSSQAPVAPTEVDRRDAETEEQLTNLRGNLGTLRAHWEDPTSLHDELTRLEKYKPKPKVRPQWNDSNINSSANEPKARVRRDKVKKRALPLSAAPSARAHMPLPGVEDFAPAPTAMALNTNGSRAPTVDETMAACDVVNAIVKHEELLTHAETIVLPRCAEGYRTALLHEVRIKAFDELTVLLSDVAQACVKATRAVARWRETLSPEKGPASVEPFIWNGDNWLLTTPWCLDFLASCNELREWYGIEFPLRRNPLMYSVNLDQRVATPRKDTQALLINGEWVEKFSEKLAKERKQDLELLEGTKFVIKNAVRWWPGSNLLEDGDERFNEFRAAEKMILEEEVRCQ
jgi:hypothetical protein